MEDKSKINEKYDWSDGWRLFARLSGWVIFPVLMAVIIGKKLDAIYKTDPWLLFLTVAIAFVISMVRMVILSLEEFKKLDAKTKKEEEKK